MPRESHFFEEAMTLCNDSDANVARLADAIYHAMLVESQHRKLVPQGPFNLLYFVQAVIRSWMLERPDISVGANTQLSKAFEPVHGFNWPDVGTYSNPIATGFINLVKMDSQPAGDDFDVTYAVKIIESLFTREGDLRHASPKQNMAEDFDYWLSGFNREQCETPGIDIDAPHDSASFIPHEPTDLQGKL